MRAHALSVLLVTALPACYSGSEPRTVATPGLSNRATTVPSHYSATIADPLGFLPIDAELVVGLDVRQIRGSGLWQRYLVPRLGKYSGGLEQFKRACKIDPIAAITHITLAGRSLDGGHPDVVMVIHGLSRTRFMDCARRDIAVVNQRAHLVGDVIEIAAKPDEVDREAMQFVGPETAVMIAGPTADKQRLANVLASGSPLRGSPGFAPLFERVAIDESMWLILNGNTKALSGAASLGFRPRALYGSIALGDGVAITLRVRLDQPADAARLVTAAQSGLATVKPMVDDLAITADDSEAVFAVTISDAKLQALLGTLGSLTTP